MHEGHASHVRLRVLGACASVCCSHPSIILPSLLTLRDNLESPVESGCFWSVGGRNPRQTLEEHAQKSLTVCRSDWESNLESEATVLTHRAAYLSAESNLVNNTRDISS